ncbi:HD domain-containing protein [Sporolactobacillus shoreicorticis]|uniref:HD domain-containing protein n=1 Tax=Sporolactobacillus shoreicorticis TaxID=1923877 RepID=A0ABW5S8J7_9BACL|nr:HD domain-containing protein [Sporolactobacillus shoreicorticis]MCO7125570.1 HD domain-containing protein [Sporolactobacillus shoreicorticis]
MDLVARTANYVQEKFYGESSGHDWWHIHRVYETSMQIVAGEAIMSIKEDVVALAALLHDIADWKFNGGNDEAGPRAAAEWLGSQNTDVSVIEDVCTIIRELSFKSAGVRTPMTSLEGEIVQDADRLDAIGAVGIARAFAYGGYKRRALFDPNVSPAVHQTADQYKTQQSPTINHFYEKLLLLHDRMNTETGKQLAEQRHLFMLSFLNRFFEESHEMDSRHAHLLQQIIKNGRNAGEQGD